MSKLVTFIVLLVLSVAVGCACGEWFYRLYLSAIPPVGQSQFNAQAAHIAFLMYGCGVGVVMFVWSLLGMAVSGILGRMPKREAAPKA
jgi:hypothetical protein